MKKILLPYANDINGNLVHINDAQKGQKYVCPNCGAELSLKISHRQKGQKNYRRPHFAHIGNSDNHCSESFLHKLFKERCAKYLCEKISAKTSVTFEWKCEKCDEEHQGNLLKKAINVVTEYNLGICQPDIALLDREGNVIIVIEVVVSHSPEPAVLEYYNNNKIACLQIKVDDYPDCNNIEEKLSHPNNVNLCPQPICKICGGIMYQPKLAIFETECWKCKRNMRLAMIIISSKMILYPDDFNEEDIKLAQSLGVTIKKQYSKTINESYLANTCDHCNAFIGDFYMYDYLSLSPDKTVDLGYRCFSCIEKKWRAEEEECRKRERLIMDLRFTENSKFCPKCGDGLTIRKSNRGYFWGCKNYPQCNYTENIKELENS